MSFGGYTLNNSDGGISFADATAVERYFPVAASQTNREFKPPPSARALVLWNPVDSTGDVTVKIGVVGTADTNGSVKLAKDGVQHCFPCSKMNNGHYPDWLKKSFFITTEADTTCEGYWIINSASDQ